MKRLNVSQVRCRSYESPRRPGAKTHRSRRRQYSSFFLSSNDKNPRFANPRLPTQSLRHLLSIVANTEQQELQTRDRKSAGEGKNVQELVDLGGVSQTHKKKTKC